MKNKRPLALLVLFLTTLCVLYFMQSRHLPEPPATIVTIGYSRLRISLPIFVAHERKLFAKYGIDDELLMYDTAQPMAQALAEGKIDLAGYTAMPISYNAMLRSGTKLYFVGMMIEDQNHRISYLLRKKPTTPNETPSIKSVADLRGKKVGILPTIAYKAWLEVILKASGVDPAEVTIQQVEPQLQLQILDQGGVDALFTNDPMATTAIAKGVAEFINPYVECPRVMGDPFPFASFNVNKAWADAHPETVKKLVGALDEAILYINQHPKQANEYMRSYLPDVFKPYVDQYPDARYLTSWESSEESFSELAKEYKSLGIIPEEIDLAGLVYRGSQSTSGSADQ